MQKRREEEEDDSGPPGVCHRLFSWVLSRLVGSISWRLSSSSSSSSSSGAAAVAAVASTEVPIEYTINRSGDHHKSTSDHEFPKKDDHGKPISVDHVLGQVVQDNTATTTAAAGGGGGRGKVMTSNNNINNKQGEEKRRWPRLSLVTNINEISDDYIRKRKAAMQRTNTIVIN